MLNSLMLSMFCANVSLLPGNSCGPTSEAFVKQVGIHGNVEMVEGYVKSTAHQYTPTVVEKSAGYGVAAYKISKGEEARIGFRVPDLCDRLEVGGSKNTQSLTLKWDF